jgi:hypothetical protein
MLRIQIYSALDMTLESDLQIRAPYCVAKFHGEILGQTDPCTETPLEPFWNSTFDVALRVFSESIHENNRPFLLEYLDIEVFSSPDNAQQRNLPVFIGATRIRLVNFLQPSWCRLLSKSYEFCGRLLVGIVLDDSSDLRKIQLLPLSSLLPSCLPQYSQLYIDFQCDTTALLGWASLPGPSVGEVVLDMHHNAEVRFISIIFIFYIYL